MFFVAIILLSKPIIQIPIIKIKLNKNHNTTSLQMSDARQLYDNIVIWVQIQINK